MPLVWLRVQEGTQAALRPWNLILHHCRVCTCCCTQWRGRGHALPQALSKGLSRPRHPTLMYWGQESMPSVRFEPCTLVSASSPRNYACYCCRPTPTYSLLSSVLL